MAYYDTTHRLYVFKIGENEFQCSATSDVEAFVKANEHVRTNKLVDEGFAWVDVAANASKQFYLAPSNFGN